MKIVWMAVLRGLAALELRDQAVDVAEHVKVAHLRSLEGEDRHAGPPDVPTGWCNTEYFAPMVAVEAHFAADAFAFFDHRQNVGGVSLECAGDPVHIARELLVAGE